MTWHNNLLKVAQCANPSPTVSQKMSLLHFDPKLVFKHNYYQHTMAFVPELQRRLHVGEPPAANSNARIINFDKTISPKAIIVQLRSALVSRNSSFKTLWFGAAFVFNLGNLF